MKAKAAKDRYRALVVGAGRIGLTLGADRLREQPASHARALAENRRIELAGAVDVDPKALAIFRTSYPRAKAYADLEEAMGKEKPDLVVVAVPEAAHASVSAAVFAHRPRLVVLEKPVAPNPAEAAAVRRAAARFRVPVQVNHERRFAADYALARSILARGDLGRPDGVRARLWSGAPVWKPGAETTGECSLLHDGTHLVDTVRFLLGPARGDRALPAPVLDFVHQGRAGTIVRLCFHYTLAKNVFVQVELAGNKRVFDFEIELAGDRGRLTIGNGFLTLWKRAPSPYYSGFHSLKRDPRVKRPAKTGYLSLMVQNCVDFLDGKAELGSPLAEGIKTLEDLYKVVVLLKSGKHV